MESNACDILQHPYFVSAPSADVLASGVILQAELCLGSYAPQDIELFLHWGQSKLPHTWCSYELLSSDLKEAGQSGLAIKHRMAAPEPGVYGATFYARIVHSGELIWAGRPEVDDACFEIPILPVGDYASARSVITSREAFERKVLEAAGDFTTFLRTLRVQSAANKARGTGKWLYELASSNAEFCSKLAEYYKTAIEEEKTAKSPYRRRRLREFLSILDNIGIGEVVFISTEGPHAIGGGLAQVITGLLDALHDSGVPATLITPMYENAQGRMHGSAEELIKNGIPFQGRNLELSEVGRVPIEMGPTYVSGSSQLKEPAQIAYAKVYCATLGSTRIFMLRHKRYARALYESAMSDELLRQSLFLSRGAINLAADPRFEIEPHVMISNDWHTALVPSLLAADRRYFSNPRLSSVETVHFLHNCGEAYQGRFFANQFGADLWPLFELDSEHYIGLSDPNDPGHLNMTAAAIRHTKRALIAVSRPYAEELCTLRGGEGLHELFKAKADRLFGVSNGIDSDTIRKVVCGLVENARQLFDENPQTEKKLQRYGKRELPAYKKLLKRAVQNQYGLDEAEDAVMISLIGRLTEQKGISLLVDSPLGNECSFLETVLSEYNKVQFVIAGPAAKNDKVSRQLLCLLSALEDKYPGRISAVPEFVSHAQALEITAASDLFLMPSRYEPGGITQLEALVAGTIVVGRNVGGIAATLINYSAESGGNAFLFSDYSSEALYRTLVRAMDVLRNKKNRRELIQTATSVDNDWQKRLPFYLAILQHATGVLVEQKEYPHLGHRKRLLDSTRPIQALKMLGA